MYCVLHFWSSGTQGQHPQLNCHRIKRTLTTSSMLKLLKKLFQNILVFHLKIELILRFSRKLHKNELPLISCH
ncbi:Protein of unknown function [Thermobacillus xylanilyticus]|uniref:Uncharacterized protein n=1 Tax=Thermobacillus xylanilyticus TaxID=76633 RepID=A0ABN7RSP9_THEXY|nr:Protein of unknown function [Thermobacillus xylanilyticus]